MLSLFLVFFPLSADLAKYGHNHTHDYENGPPVYFREKNKYIYIYIQIQKEIIGNEKMETNVQKLILIQVRYALYRLLNCYTVS